MPSDEVFIPLPVPVPPLTEVRSALLTSSLLSVRERGHEARYLTLLDPRYQDALLYNPAGLGRVGRPPAVGDGGVVFRFDFRGHPKCTMRARSSGPA